MERKRLLGYAGLGLATAVAAIVGGFAAVAEVEAARSGDAVSSDVRRTYGEPVKLGNGRARTYVVTDITGRTPIEIGVALDERSMEGLPPAGTGHHTGHGEMHEYILPLPAKHGTQYQFVGLNWNVAGHVPPGVYDTPHFDFHFYVISRAERDRIVRTDPEFVARGNNLPPAEFVPPFTVAAAPPGLTPGEDAVEQMGVHWADVRSPELQALLGKPDAYRPFTSTFIHGSWDGRFIFWEPMITRAHIMAKKSTTDAAVRDEIIPVSTPAKYQMPGYYPNAYRITWDAKAREYRIALTGLAKVE